MIYSDENDNYRITKVTILNTDTLFIEYTDSTKLKFVTTYTIRNYNDVNESITDFLEGQEGKCTGGKDKLIYAIYSLYIAKLVKDIDNIKLLSAQQLSLVDYTMPTGIKEVLASLMNYQDQISAIKEKFKSKLTYLQKLLNPSK